MKKITYKSVSIYELLLDKIHKECVYTGSTACSMCPYAVFDENGSSMCYKDTYEHCMKVNLDEYFAKGDAC